MRALPPDNKARRFDILQRRIFWMFLLALTTFLSAFLLFLLQPIIGKHILPWFGGSAAVWSTCLVFFQTALLAGYFYSDRIANRYSLRTQGIVHLSLLALAIALLPITP